MFSVVQRAGFDAVGFMIDCPSAAKADRASYIAAIEEFIAAYPGAGATAKSPTRAAVICSLPESLDAKTREMCLAAGVVPLQGQRQALEALDLAASVGEAWASGARVELRTPARQPDELDSVRRAGVTRAPGGSHVIGDDAAGRGSSTSPSHAASAPAVARPPTVGSIGCRRTVGYPGPARPRARPNAQ